METAQQAVKTLTALWLQELDAGPSDQANALKKQLDEAEAKLKRAKKEFEEAEQKYGSKASVQAGRGQAGGLLHVELLLLTLVCTPAWSSCVFVGVHRCCFLGSCSPLGKDPLVVKLSPLRSLGAFRRGGALGCFRFHKKMWLHLFCRVEKACYANLFAPRVLPMLQNGGVNPRLEVRGSACFPLALRSRGCGCFCLRLDFQLAVSVRGSQGTWVLSACL